MAWLEVAVQDLVFVEPLGLEDLVVSHFIRIIVGQVWQDVVLLGIRVHETVLVFPLILVHSEHELLAAVHFDGYTLVLQPLLLLANEKLLVRIGEPFIAFEVTAATQLVDLGFRRLRIIQISVLLLAGVFENLIGSKLVGQLTQSVIVASAEAALDQVTLFIGVLVQQLRQVG